MSEIEQLRKEIRELLVRIVVLERQQHTDINTTGWRTPPPEIVPIPRWPDGNTVTC